MRKNIRFFSVLMSMLVVLSACGSGTAPVPAALPPGPLDSGVLDSGPGALPEPPPEPEPEPEPDRPSPEEVEAIGEWLAPAVEEICRDYYVAGMSLVVFDQWGPLWQHSCGWASAEENRPAGEDTAYRIASISKAVTAMLAVDLAGQGKLDLDGDLSDIMGVTVRNPSCPEEVITPRHLLTHTSGLVDSGAYGSGITSNPLWPLEQVVSQSFAPYPPGTCYIYSNFGMGMMSGVVESAAGERFLAYTKEQVFDPMGIDAGYSYDSIQNKERVANIYEGSALSVYMPNWLNMSHKYETLPVGQLYGLGHGDLFISARDLSRFARILAGAPQEGEPVRLEPELLRQMQTVQYREGEGESAILRGLGTQITDYLITDRRMVGHQGNAYGSICGMFVDPEQHTGFVFLTSGAWMGKDEAGIYYVNRDIGRAVYGAFFGYGETETEESPGTELIISEAPEGEAGAASPIEESPGTEMVVSSAPKGEEKVAQAK